MAIVVITSPSIARPFSKIWGLDAPQKVEVQARNPYADMTDDDLRAELARQARLLLAGDVPAPPVATPSATASSTAAHEKGDPDAR